MSKTISNLSGVYLREYPSEKRVPINFWAYEHQRKLIEDKCNEMHIGISALLRLLIEECLGNSEKDEENAGTQQISGNEIANALYALADAIKNIGGTRL